MSTAKTNRRCGGPRQLSTEGEYRVPRQQRSRATSEAMLDAGARSISEHGIDGTSIARVARLANTSVGALYFRFKDKETFVEASLQRAFDLIREDTDHVLAQSVHQGMSASQVIDAFLELAIRVLLDNQGLIRAVLKRALSDRNAWEPLGQLSADASQRLIDTLEQFPEVTTIPHWRERVQFGIHAARAAVFHSLFNSQAPLPSDRAALRAELLALVCSYVGLPVGDDA